MSHCNNSEAHIELSRTIHTKYITTDIRLGFTNDITKMYSLFDIVQSCQYI